MPKKTTVPGSLENVIKNGKTIGFKFGVRLPRYRGNMLSLVNGYYVSVNDEVFEQSALTFEINGKPPRSFAEIRTAVWEHWNFEDVAYLHVVKPGGLAPGKYTVIAAVSNYEQYGYLPGSDEKRVEKDDIPTASGSGFAGPTLPVELELKQGGE